MNYQIQVEVMEDLEVLVNNNFYKYFIKNNQLKHIIDPEG